MELETSATEFSFSQHFPIMTDPDWETYCGEVMKIRLTYEGALPAASKSNTRVRVKRRIREAFHPQLRRLWQVHPTLKDLQLAEMHDGGRAFKEWKPATEALAQNFEICGYHFVPLINQQVGQACKISILFLRPEQPGHQLISSGDIDNRLKVLLDALKMPKDRGEIGNNPPTEDQEPFFCLLEDDKLINHLEVETDLMLQDVDGHYDENHVRLVITVETIRVGQSMLSLAF